MQSDDSTRPLRSLRRNGYAYLHRLYPNIPTIDVAALIGEVFDIQEQFPELGAATIQVLQPHHQLDAKGNQYSGTYGLAEFPLHTDLAHWAIPPRYILLRCVNGSPGVATKLLHCSSIESVIGTTPLRHALARPRRLGLHRTLSLLSVRLNLGDEWGMRWDPLFLTPMNVAGQDIANTMSNHVWKAPILRSMTLADRGDTLVIDNYRCLHGRTGVSVDDLSRRIERVYLSELHT